MTLFRGVEFQLAMALEKSLLTMGLDISTILVR